MPVREDPGLRRAARPDEIRGDVLAAAGWLLICFLDADIHDEARPVDRDEALLQMGGITSVVSEGPAGFVCHIYYYSGYNMI